MELYWFVYFTKDGEEKLIGKYKEEMEAFDCITKYCDEHIGFKDLEVIRSFDGFLVKYGKKGEYFSAFTKWD